MEARFAHNVRIFFNRDWQIALRWRFKLVFKEEPFHLLLAGFVGILGGLVIPFFYCSGARVQRAFLAQSGDPVQVAEMFTTKQRLLVPTLGCMFLANLLARAVTVGAVPWATSSRPCCSWARRRVSCSGSACLISAGRPGCQQARLDWPAWGHPGGDHTLAAASHRLRELNEFLIENTELDSVIDFDVMRPPQPSLTPGPWLVDALPVLLQSEQRNVSVISRLEANEPVGSPSRAEALPSFPKSSPKKANRLADPVSEIVAFFGSIGRFRLGAACPMHPRHRPFVRHPLDMLPHGPFHCLTQLFH